MWKTVIIILSFVFFYTPCLAYHYNNVYVDKNKLLIAKQVIQDIQRKDWRSAYHHANKDVDILRFIKIMSCTLQKDIKQNTKCPINITYSMLNNSLLYNNVVDSKPTIINEQYKSSALNDLIWSGKLKEVEAYMHKHKVDAIIKLRLKLKQGKISERELSNVQSLINKNFGLRVDYINWCIRNKKLETGLKLLMSTSEKSISHPQQFWDLKKLFIREVIYNKIKKLYRSAYLLSTTYYDSGINFNDAEWLAGWISLELLNNPQTAIAHFTKLYSRVLTPISISKATYWLARAYEKFGNVQMSEKMYKIASNNYHTFYGQLSMIKVAKNTKVSVENNYFSEIKEYSMHLKQDYFEKMCYITALINENNISYAFLEYIVKRAKTQEELFSIYSMIKQTHNPYISIMYAKLLEKNGIIFHDILYPTHYSNIVKEHEVSAELIYSIMRQESRFAQYAKSKAGALGIMQLMPNTAKHITKKIGAVHKNDFDLVENLRYNIMLGANSIKETLDYYNNSLIPAIAAYNAGIANVNKWINTLGDVRKLKTVEERIDWIESIPFYETRDYVVRVLENLSNYKKSFNNDKNHKSIVNDVMS